MAPPTNLPGTGEPDINNGPKLLGATGTVTAAALIAVIARLWIRKFVLKFVGWDDKFIILAMVKQLSLYDPLAIHVDEAC